MKPNFIILTVSNFNWKTQLNEDEKIFINASEISEVLPKEMGEKRGVNNDFNAVVVMTNGNIYRVIEDLERVITLATQ